MALQILRKTTVSQEENGLQHCPADIGVQNDYSNACVQDHKIPCDRVPTDSSSESLDDPEKYQYHVMKHCTDSHNLLAHKVEEAHLK